MPSSRREIIKSALTAAAGSFAAGAATVFGGVSRKTETAAKGPQPSEPPATVGRVVGIFAGLDKQDLSSLVTLTQPFSRTPQQLVDSFDKSVRVDPGENLQTVVAVDQGVVILNGKQLDITRVAQAIRTRWPVAGNRNAVVGGEHTIDVWFRVQTPEGTTKLFRQDVASLNSVPKSTGRSVMTLEGGLKAA